MPSSINHVPVRTSYACLVPVLQTNNDAIENVPVALRVLLDIKLSLFGRLAVGVSEREESRICPIFFLPEQLQGWGYHPLRWERLGVEEFEGKKTYSRHVMFAMTSQWLNREASRF